ncbi:N-acetylmuramoyl-L-alanine amidase, partial [Clostridium gasigenes]
YEMVAEGITVHNTANDASANNEVSYMRNNDKEVSFTYAVDDIEIVQGLLANRNGWHSGDGGNGYGNRKTISIEICYSKSGGARFDKAEENAADLIAMLLKQNGLGINKVYTHMYFDKYKKYCPARTMDKGWNRFVNMIKAKLNGTVIPSTPSPVRPTPSIQLYRIRRSWADVASQKGAYKDINNAISCCIGGYSVFDVSGNKVFPSNQVATPPKPVNISEYKTGEKDEIGIFTCNVASINFRNNPLIDPANPIQGQYFEGENVNYDYVYITNLYVYISWIGGTGVRRYMPVRDKSTGEVWGTFE